MSQTTLSASPPSRPSPGAATKPALTGAARAAIASAVGVVVLVVAGIAWYFAYRGDRIPRLDAPVEEIARFVGGEIYATLPFERQKLYMEALDNREEELDQAYGDRRLPALDYKRALEFAWCGKHLPRAEKYGALPRNERAAYVKARYDKKDEKERKKKKAGDGDSEVMAATAVPGSPLVEVKRDEQAEKDIPRTWPDEWQRKWKLYRGALKEEREARLEAKEDRELATEAASNPG